VIGVGMTVLKNPEFNWIGFLCAVGSMIFGIAQNITIGVLIQRASLNILIIALTTSLPVVLTLIPGFLLLEYPLCKYLDLLSDILDSDNTCY
jgi:hypothetical protein